jgi:hypothetical protein
MIIIKYLIHSLAPLFHMLYRLHLNEFLHRTGQPLVDLLVDPLNLYLLLVLHDCEWHKTPDLTILRLPVLPYRDLPRINYLLKQFQILYR